MFVSIEWLNQHDMIFHASTSAKEQHACWGHRLGSSPRLCKMVASNQVDQSVTESVSRHWMLRHNKLSNFSWDQNEGNFCALMKWQHEKHEILNVRNIKVLFRQARPLGYFLAITSLEWGITIFKILNLHYFCNLLSDWGPGSPKNVYRIRIINHFILLSKDQCFYC